MSRAFRRPVEDFEAVFRAISLQKETVILVGGHAVNVWALSYRDRLGEVLTPLLPFTSSDMDVYATRNALIGLHETLGGKLLLSGPREITDGTLIVGVEPDTRELDVLRSVNGLPKLDARDAIPLVVCGHTVPVLFPHLLLQAKLENARWLDQRERQDVKHVRIMALVLREFLREVVVTASLENEKYALPLLRRALAVLMSESAREFTRRHGLSFAGVMPEAELQASPLRKLSGFGQDELVRLLANQKPIRQGRR
jgi:hypothetical protein